MVAPSAANPKGKQFSGRLTNEVDTRENNDNCLACVVAWTLCRVRASSQCLESLFDSRCDQALWCLDVFVGQSVRDLRGGCNRDSRGRAPMWLAPSVERPETGTRGTIRIDRVGMHSCTFLFPLAMRNGKLRTAMGRAFHTLLPTYKESHDISFTIASGGQDIDSQCCHGIPTASLIVSALLLRLPSGL